MKFLFLLFTVDYLADLYCEAQKTYTIQDDEKITTVLVERDEFHLTEEAPEAFEAIHDQWELQCNSMSKVSI